MSVEQFQLLHHTEVANVGAEVKSWESPSLERGSLYETTFFLLIQALSGAEQTQHSICSLQLAGSEPPRLLK